MKPEDSSLLSLGDTLVKDPAPSRTEKSPERVLSSDVEGDLTGLEQKRLAMSKTLDETQEKTSWILQFSLHWEEINKELNERAMEVDLKDKSVLESLKQLETREKELKEKEEIVKAKSEEIESKSKLLEEKAKELDLKQRELEAKETELKANEVEKKEQILEAKAREMEWKSKFLELKQREIEGRSTQGQSSKRPRLKMLAQKSSEAVSFIRPENRHNSVCGASACASSSEQTIEKAHEEEEELVSVDEIGEEEQPITIPDSEFNDFAKTMDSFAVGQVWALYDPIDGMPRLYGRIKKVLKSQLSVVVTWVEPREEEESVGPVSCGRFKFGITETQGYMMFSHEMRKVIKGRYLITMYPMKGETWALNPELHKPPYRHEFVEILLDFDKHGGVGVTYLEKVEGFVSVFKHAGQHGIVLTMIRPMEMHRFSHKIPSFKLSGQEKGVPAGSFELDPAAIPSSILRA